MIGKRGIRIKRPAVLCAAAFVVGIVLARYPWWITIVASVGVLVGCVCFLRRLQNGRRRSSVMDRILFCVPVFLVVGYFVMSREQTVYVSHTESFAACMEHGREVLAEGTISYLGWTGSGVRLELKDAKVSSYQAKETRYRSVGTLLVYTDSILAENEELKKGQKIFIYGAGSEFESASNPGGFDAKSYYFSLGISGAIHAKTIRVTDGSYHYLSRVLFQAKNKLLNSYVTYLGEEGAGVIASMLLGERSLLSDETEELYRHGGISHILAISGLHVSLVGMALYNALRKTFLGRNGAIPAACMGVLLYGTFVEAGTSTKRAVIMFLLLLLATALGRTYDTLSAMAVSMIVILCQSPGALYTASFQLSYAAAYGASVVALLLQERERERSVEEKAILAAKRSKSGWFRFREYVGRKGKGIVIFGLAIQIVTFPFTVIHFFEYPGYGFLINPIVVPLMTILLFCGFLSGVCGMIVPWLGYFFAGGTGGILWVYERLCEIVETLPFSLLLFGKPAVIQVVIYFVLVAICLVVCQNNRVRMWCILLILPVVLLPLPGAKFAVSFLDVGQGDCIVLRERSGGVLMVDGGSTGIQEVGEKRIIPYLKSQGIRVIDCTFVSHTDMDHISGIKEIMTEMPPVSEYRKSVAGYSGTPLIKCLVLPKQENADETYLELVELADTKEVQLIYLSEGDRMRIGDKLAVSCLAPREGMRYKDKNAASMVLVASYDEFDILFAGDMDKKSESMVLESRAFRELYDKGEQVIDVLKVAHHGSRTASSWEFIEEIRPDISVISCGKDNRYGHPHTETMESLSEINSRIYRTDEGGCVTIKFGKRVTIKKYRGGS